MFHLMRAGALRASWLGTCALMLSFATAQADTVHIDNCIWSPSSLWRGGGAGNCVEKWGEAVDPYVRTVPQPTDETERARAAERDHKWLQRCRPIVAQDRYGVPRYHYAAPGCDFGVIE